MAEAKAPNGATLRVVDALTHPHGGRLLRLRRTGGPVPTVRGLSGATLRAVSPDGREATITISGFSLFGGRPTDGRIERTGRVDVRVEGGADAAAVTTGWELFVPSE